MGYARPETGFRGVPRKEVMKAQRLPEWKKYSYDYLPTASFLGFFASSSFALRRMARAF